MINSELVKIPSVTRIYIVMLFKQPSIFPICKDFSAGNVLVRSSLAISIWILV